MMKKNSKRMLLVATVLASLFGLVSPNYSYADTTVSTFSDLQTALTSETGIITIDADITATSNLNSIGQSGVIITAANAYTLNGNSNAGFVIGNEITAAIKGNNKLTITNFSSTNGGAIYNEGITTISGGIFTNNTASNYGGAIYNKGTMTFAGRNTFTGNTSNSINNDIYNEGTVNFTGTNKLDGGIRTAGPMGIVNITSGHTTVNYELRGQTVNLTGGELHLAGTGSTGTNINGSTINVGSGAIINTIDNFTNAYNMITLQDGAIVKGDVLSNSESADLFYTIDSGAHNITYIPHLVGTDNPDGNYYEITTTGGLIFNGGNAVIVNNTLGELYKFTQTYDGSTEFKASAVSGTGINGAINATSSARTIVNYDLTTNENVITEHGIINSDFTINGDGIGNSDHTLTIQDDDLKLDSDSILTLNNLKVSGDAMSEIRNNGGTLNINDSKYDNGYIINRSNLNFNYTKSADVSMSLISDEYITDNSITTFTVDGANTDVNFTLYDSPSTGSGQDEFIFKGNGHFKLIQTSEPLTSIHGNFTNQITDNTLEISGFGIGGNVLNPETGHLIFSNGSSLSKDLINEGILDIHNGTSYLTDPDGISDTAGTGAKGTLNIGDGTNNAILDAAFTGGTYEGTNIIQNQINILEKGTLKVHVPKLTTPNAIANDGILILTSGGENSTLANGITRSNTTGYTDIDAGDYTITFSGDVDNDVNVLTGTLDNNAQITGNINVSSDAVLYSTAANINGNLTNEGTFNLEGASLMNVAGSGTTILQNAVAAAADYTIAGTLDANGKEIDMADGTNYKTLSAGVFTSNNASLKVDIDMTNTSNVDRIATTSTTSASGGTINLTDINLNNATILGSQIHQIIDNAYDSSSLALTLGITSKTGVGTGDVTYDDTIKADTAWSDEYSHHEIIGATLDAAFELATTNTTNDSVKTTITREAGTGTDTTTSLGDTLALVVQDTTNTTKTFTADTDNNYTVSADLGTLGGSQLSIIGTGHTAEILGNNKAGITISNADQILNITDVTGIGGFNGAAIDNTAGGAINISGSTVTSDIINDGQDAGKGVTLTGTNNITKIKDSAGTGNSGKTIIDDGTSTVGTIAQKELLITDDGKLIINAGNLKVANNSSIQNAGTLELTGGTLGKQIHGTGHTDVNTTGQVTFGANVWQHVNVLSGKLKTKANNIKSGATNNATLELSGNTLTSDVDGTGKTNITGDVTVDSGVRLAQDGGIFIKSGATQVTNNGIMAGGLTNGSSSYTSATVTNSGIISDGMLNYGTVENITPTIENGGIYGGLTNHGTVTNTGTDSEHSAIIGTIYNQADGTVTNNAYGIILNLTNANTTSGAVTNNVNGIITNLNNSGDVVNAGMLTNVYNSGNIDNTGILTNIVNNYANGQITTAASGFTSTAIVKNDGTITFTGGDITTDISSYSTAATGTVEIDAGAGNTVSVLTANNITDNNLKLTSGTFDATNRADSNGNINFATSGLGSGIIANGGTLTVQDGKQGSINLGNVNTEAAPLNVLIDAQFTNGTIDDQGFLGTADILNGTISGSNKVAINKIKITADPVASEFRAQVADASIAGKVDVTTTTLDGLSPAAGSVLIEYNSTTGFIKGGHETLKDAILSTIPNKLYVVNNNADSDLSTAGDLTLGGTSLSVTANDKLIQGAGNKISLDNSGQTLSFSGSTGTTTMDGFATAIDNTAGGTVNLTNVTFTNNTDNDVNNAGTLNLNGNIVLDDAGILNTGTVNNKATVSSGTITNEGVFNNEAGAAVTSAYIQEVTAAETNIYGNSSMTLGTGSVISDGTVSLGNAASSGSITFNNGVDNAAKVLSTGDNSSISLSTAATSLTLKSGSDIDKETAITIAANTTLNASGTSIKGGGSEGITNDGTFNLTNDGATAGTLARAINNAAGDGTTGTINLTGTTESSAAGTINQANIKVDDGTFTMGANIIANTLLEITDDGIIANAEKEINAKALNNEGEITGVDGNYGNLTVGNGASISSGNITQNNITLAGGTFDNTGTMTSNGIFTNHATVTGDTGTLNINNGTSDKSITQAIITVAGEFENNAALTAKTNLTVYADGELTNNDAITAALLDNYGKVNNAENAAINADTITNSGDIINDSTITVSDKIVSGIGSTITNNKDITTKSLINYGDYKNTDENATLTADDVENHGNITNKGTTTVSNSIVNAPDGTITNEKTITAKVIENYDDITNNAGADIVAETIQNYANGDIVNNGKIESTVFLANEGTITGTGNLTAKDGSNTNEITQNNITLVSGTFDNTGTITSTGTFTNNDTITGDTGTLNVNNGTSNGSITQAIVTVAGEFENNAALTAKNNLTVYADGELTNNDAITAALLDNYGDVNNAENAAINADTITNSGDINNDGTITVSDKIVSGIGSTITNNKDITTKSLINYGDYKNTDENTTLTADDVENHGNITNKGTTTVSNSIVNAPDGTITNEKTITAKVIENYDDITNNAGADIVAETIQNYANGNLANDGTVTTSEYFANEGKVTGSGNLYVTSGRNAGSIEQELMEVTAGIFENQNGATIDATDFLNDSGATLTNDGIVSAIENFKNDGTVNNTTEGAGTLNIKNGYSNNTITQGIVNISGDNTAFDNNAQMNIEKLLDNGGTLNNTSDINVTNSAKDATLDNGGVINTTDASTITANKLRNTNAVINMTNADLTVTDQDENILGTINIKGANVSNDVSEIAIGGINPVFKGTLNVGDINDKSVKSTLKFLAGDIDDEATVNIAKGNVLNVAEDTSKGEEAYVVLNENDTFKGDVVLDNGTVEMKNVSYTTGDKSTTKGGKLPYYEQNGGNLALTNSILTMKDSSRISDGNMLVDSSSIFNSEKNGFNVDILANGGLVNTINGDYEHYGVKTLLAGDGGEDKQGDFKIDIFARSNDNKKYDDFGSSSTKIRAANGKSGIINISDWNLNGDLMGKDAPTDRSIELNVFKGSASKVHFISTDKEVFTPIGWYKLNSKGGGTYALEVSRFNPEVFRGQVTKVAQYQNQLAIDDMLFNHTMLDQGFKGNDKLASIPNRYASANDLYAPYQYSRKDGGVWVKNYANFERLNMNHGLNAGNNAYGTIIGADFGLKDLSRGWKFMPTAYIAYNGAHQYWNGTGAYQNGGQMGVMGTWYKDDFMVGALAFGGLYGNDMTTSRGHDDAFNYFAGAATKVAYNWKIHKDWSIQPNLFAAYSYFGQENWHTDFGQMGMMSGMLHGVNIAPGLNLIYERETFSAYATLQYMYNVNQSTGGKAGNVDLPNVHMDRGYLQYGIGINKQFTESFSGYFQTVLRNVGRTGIGLQLGLNWQLGGNKKSKKVTGGAANIVPQKTVIKQLSKKAYKK